MFPVESAWSPWEPCSSIYEAPPADDRRGPLPASRRAGCLLIPLVHVKNPLLLLHHSCRVSLSMDYDRNDALLHWIFRQTQGDAWFRPNEEHISSGVALRISDGRCRSGIRDPQLMDFQLTWKAHQSFACFHTKTPALSLSRPLSLL